MKSRFTLGSALILGILFLTGCSEKNTQTDTDGSSSKVNKEIVEDVQEVLSTEVTDVVNYAWVDASTGDTPKYSTYAAIKNTSNQSIDVSQTSVSYLDAEGNLISITNASDIPFTSIAPTIIKPGEFAYLGVNEDADENLMNAEEINVDVSPQAAYTEPIYLETDKANVVKSNNGWGDYLNVTGFVNNSQNTQLSSAYNLQTAAALYDGNDKFLGAVFLGTGQEINIPPSGNAGIELGIPSFPADQVSNVDHAEIKAIILE